MGVGIFDHYRSDNRIPINSIQTIIERVEAEKKAKNPNPDPYNWIINDTFINGSWDKNIYLLIDITYPDCTNYEGRKIMLYENVTEDDLRKQKTLDPHFSSNKRFHSPIARFEPTKEGWEMGKLLAMELYNKEKNT
jgi:hypothetical protein